VIKNLSLTDDAFAKSRKVIDAACRAERMRSPKRLNKTSSLVLTLVLAVVGVFERAMVAVYCTCLDKHAL
jgi:hypothetical protein